MKICTRLAEEFAVSVNQNWIVLGPLWELLSIFEEIPLFYLKYSRKCLLLYAQFFLPLKEKKICFSLSCILIILLITFFCIFSICFWQISCIVWWHCKFQITMVYYVPSRNWNWSRLYVRCYWSLQPIFCNRLPTNLFLFEWRFCRFNGLFQ